MLVVGTPGFQDGVQIPAVSLLDNYQKALAFFLGLLTRLRRWPQTALQVSGNYISAMSNSCWQSSIVKYFYKIKTESLLVWFFGECGVRWAYSKPAGFPVYDLPHWASQDVLSYGPCPHPLLGVHGGLFGGFEGFSVPGELGGKWHHVGMCSLNMLGSQRQMSRDVTGPQAMPQEWEHALCHSRLWGGDIAHKSQQQPSSWALVAFNPNLAGRGWPIYESLRAPCYIDWVPGQAP